MHNTRNEMPNSWPIARKGTKYFSMSSHANRKGIPVAIVLRDILKIVKTMKEARYLLLNKEVKINGKARKEEKFPINLFDILTIEKLNKNYELVIDGKKVKFKEISAKDATKKTVKIIGKVLLTKNKMQINLADGSNYIMKEQFAVGDSVIINLKENKIEKIIALKDGAKVFVMSGKHSGKQGKVIESKKEKGEYIIKFEDEEAVLPTRLLLAME